MPMKLEERLGIIKSVGEEIVTESELSALLKIKPNPVAYDGFEPSGNAHIAVGLLRTININKMIKAGCSFKILIADWHAWANNKMGGDLEAIQKVGKYMIEVWKACGMDINKVKFVWAKDIVKDDEYWKIVMNIMRDSTVKRLVRCSQIMGRSESDELSGAQLLYPAMQAADIFYLGADITQLGMDQRKVNVLAREVGPKLGFYKPIVVSHHMLMGLRKPPERILNVEQRAMEMKMSKSVPDSAIFMTDPKEEVERKIMKAYCMERSIEDNPVLEYFKFIIFEKSKKVKIQKKGGYKEYDNFEALAHDYLMGKIHPSDLKAACASYINKYLDPVRKHFEKDKRAKELQDFVMSARVTR